MIQINLLPHHLRPVKRTPLPYLLSIAVLGGAVAWMALTYLGARDEIRAAEAALDERRSELAALQVYVDQANELAAEKQALAHKIGIIEEIVSGRMLWSRVLHDLSRLAPDNFWYSGISVETQQYRERRTERDPETGATETRDITLRRPILRVQGYVADSPGSPTGVSPLMQAAESDPDFSSRFQLEPPSLRPAEFEGQNVTSFTLEFLIEGGLNND